MPCKRRRLAILRAGAQRPAELALAQEQPQRRQQHDRGQDDVKPLIGEHDAVGEHDLALRRRRHMLHLHAEAEHGDGLQDQQESDRGDQPAERIVAQRPEQAALHDQPEQPTKRSPMATATKNGMAAAGIERDDRVGPGHVELAMGEIDDAHDAEDQHEAHGDERHVARGIGRVDDGLEEQLRGHRQRSAIRTPSMA